MKLSPAFSVESSRSKSLGWDWGQIWVCQLHLHLSYAFHRTELHHHNWQGYNGPGKTVHSLGNWRPWLKNRDECIFVFVKTIIIKIQSIFLLSLNLKASNLPIKAPVSLSLVRPGNTGSAGQPLSSIRTISSSSRPLFAIRFFAKISKMLSPSSSILIKDEKICWLLIWNLYRIL